MEHTKEEKTVKSTLKIESLGDVLVIKKRASIFDIIMFGLIIGATVALPYIMKGALGEWWFWAVYALVVFSNVAQAISLFFGKVILDKGKREITLGLLRSKAYSFDEISFIDYKFEEGDPEGRDRYKVIIHFKNGYKKHFETNSREQTMEMVELIQSEISKGK